MTDRVYNVLFLCTGNSARSILAESILTQEGAGRFRAFSAGSRPKGQVNPFALKTLAAHGYPTEGLRSKSWEEFAGPDAPKMDFVLTVCDGAAGESCPVWPGHPMTAHWGIEDPAAVEGPDLRKAAAFVTALRHLRTRIAILTALPLKSLDAPTLGARLREIGRGEGDTRAASARRPDPVADRSSAGIDVVIYHNPDCGTSRNTLGLIRNAGVEPHVVEYLKTPPTREMLRRLAARMGLPLRGLLRRKGTPYDALGLDDPALDDAALLDAVTAHPILIERPIVVSPRGVRLCRPSEAVLDLLPPQRGEFRKEDGALVVDASGRPAATA